MPFSDLANITLEERQKMTDAFDRVCARLKLKPADPARTRLAISIVNLVENGCTADQIDARLKAEFASRQLRGNPKPETKG